MKPKFNLNRPPINDEEINSNKDFGELVKKFKKQSIEKARTDTSFLKNKKITYASIIAGVAVICTITYFSVFKKKPLKQNTHDKIITIQNTTSSPKKDNNSKSFIAPPVSKLNVPYTSYKFKAEDGATVTHKSKSKIIIPKKAFINKQGQDIVGDVEIRYREFHDKADIIASGIPMRYDSAGVITHLESAGMLDIRGYQNNEPVFIKPDKKIMVEFASGYTDDKYNMYILDTIAKNWIYTGRDNSLRNASINFKNENIKELTANGLSQSEKAKALQKSIDAIPPKIQTEKIIYEKKIAQLVKASQPSVPNKITAGRPRFALDVNYKEFPELEAFKNAVFEVGTENKNYNNKLADVTWESATISEGPLKGKNYLLTLKIRERVEKLIVYPALTDADYDIALKLYEQKFADYKSGVLKSEANEKKLKEEFEAKQLAYIEEQKKLKAEITLEQIRYQQELSMRQSQQLQNIGNSQKVMRIFSISNFGICNSDCPAKMPREAKLNPIFIVDNIPTLSLPEAVYLLCHNKNLIFTYANGPIGYNVADEYSLCVLMRGKLFVCDKNTFSNCVVAKQNKIPLKEISADITNVDELRLALGI